MNNSEQSAETAAQQSGAAEVSTSSQTIANALVVGSPSRPIKFRAWDDGKMVYPTGALADIKRFFRVIREDAPIMQFTGLHDKNGNEIYEGDIICRKGPHGMDKVKLVKWHDAYVATGFNISRTKDNREIIGNFYETPELLERVK